MNPEKKAKVLAYAAKYSAAKAARKFNVHPVTISRWRAGGKQLAAKKHLSAHTTTGHEPSAQNAVAEAVRWAIFGYEQANKKR